MTILADTAVRAKDIDEAAALEAKRRAEEMLSDKSGKIDYAWRRRSSPRPSCSSGPGEVSERPGASFEFSGPTTYGAPPHFAGFSFFTLI